MGQTAGRERSGEEGRAPSPGPCVRRALPGACLQSPRRSSRQAVLELGSRMAGPVFIFLKCRDDIPMGLVRFVTVIGDGDGGPLFPLLVSGF